MRNYTDETYNTLADIYGRLYVYAARACWAAQCRNGKLLDGHQKLVIDELEKLVHTLKESDA